jgi:hypothetical protein
MNRPAGFPAPTFPGWTFRSETIWAEATWSGPPADAISAWGIFGLFGATSGQVSPSTVLNLLTVTGAPLADIGTQSLDGFATTHYRASIPLSALARQMPRTYNKLPSS